MAPAEAFAWFTPQRDGPDTLQAQIVDWIAALIADGRLAPGARLPAEATLVERLGVSRVTVRLAFDELVARGLVARSHGRGSFVAAPVVQHDLHSDQGFFDILFARATRPEAQLLAFEPAVPPQELAAQFGLAPGGQAVRIDRLYLSAGRGVIYATGWLTPDALHLGRADLETRSTATLHSDVLRHPVTRSTTAISAELAAAAVARRLGLRPRSAVLVLTRARFDADGRLRETNRFTIDPAAYEFTLSADGRAPVSAELRAVAA